LPALPRPRRQGRRPRGDARIPPSSLILDRSRPWADRRPDLPNRQPWAEEHAVLCGAGFTGGPLGRDLVCALPPGRSEPMMSSAMARFLRAISLAGAATVVAGLLWSPARTWTALLIAGYLLTGFGLAGIVFVAVQYACGAGWSASFRRVPEAMSA